MGILLNNCLASLAWRRPCVGKAVCCIDRCLSAHDGVQGRGVIFASPFGRQHGHSPAMLVSRLHACRYGAPACSGALRAAGDC